MLSQVDVDKPMLLFDLPEVGNSGTRKLFMKHRTTSIFVPEDLSSPFCWETINGKTAFMTDYALAARNAGAKIWVSPNTCALRNTKFKWDMCASHVFGRWMEKNGKFRDQVCVVPHVQIHQDLLS